MALAAYTHDAADRVDAYVAATQLNALMGIAMTAVAGIALAVRGPRLPMTKHTLGALGVGVMIGTASVFYFLGRARGAAIALTLLGATLLGLSTG